MNQPYGPWATLITAGQNPQLGTFWRRRLHLLVPVSQSSPAMSRQCVATLFAMALLLFLLPTLQPGPVTAQEPNGTHAADQQAPPSASPEGFREEEFHVACWEQVLGLVDPPNLSHPRHPPSTAVQRTWDRITAMPAEKAWFLLTQLERPEHADLWPVDRTLDWADKHVPREVILESTHAAASDGRQLLAGRAVGHVVSSQVRAADRPRVSGEGHPRPRGDSAAGRRAAYLQQLGQRMDLYRLGGRDGPRQRRGFS